jgi:NADH-quinone oxidoreductase subunit N
VIGVSSAFILLFWLLPAPLVAAAGFAARSLF